MKIKLLFVSFLFMAVCAKAELTGDGKMLSKANIQWKSKTIEMIDLEKNKSAEATFSFVNNGDKPIMITKVKSSCGCTVASYDAEPIMPGDQGTVIATYNAKREGTFRKSVTVYLCDDSAHHLVIKGNVK